MAEQLFEAKDDYVSSDDEKDNGFIMLTDDNELQKKILIPGDCDGITPPKNSTVQFHYIAKIIKTGKQFNTSRIYSKNKNGKTVKAQPMSFTLGEKKHIYALEVGLATMKRNEISLIRCSPKYGYGEKGLDDKVPPNAWLEFGIEFIGWNEWQILNDNEDFKKKVIINGYKSIIPTNDDLVTLSWKGCTEQNHIFGQGNNVTVTCDDDYKFPEAFHVALKHMEYGEHSIIECSDYNLAYGLEGNIELDIPYFAQITYDIHIHHIQTAKDKNEYNDLEKTEKAKKFKIEGNELFSKNLYREAIKKYNKSLQWNLIINKTNKANDEILKIKQELIIDVNNNISLIYLKQKEYDKVIEYAEKVLIYDTKNVKALSRCGHAKIMQNKYIEARVDLKNAKLIDKNNSYVNKLYNIANNKIKQYKEKQKKQYQSMFGYRPDKNKKIKNQNNDEK